MTSDYRHIRLENPAEGLLKIELVAASGLWSLNEESAQELLDGVVHFNSQQHYKVLLLAGSGPAFCAGADLNIDMSEDEEKLIPQLRDRTRLADGRAA
jgi:Enoyl-CoA hydratase/carnithine racemase